MNISQPILVSTHSHTGSNIPDIILRYDWMLQTVTVVLWTQVEASSRFYKLACLALKSSKQKCMHTWCLNGRQSLKSYPQSQQLQEERGVKTSVFNFDVWMENSLAAPPGVTLCNWISLKQSLAKKCVFINLKTKGKNIYLLIWYLPNSGVAKILFTNQWLCPEISSH